MAEKLWCSFCGKSNTDPEVRFMVAGVTAMICGACIRICTEILEERERNSDPPGRAMTAADLGCA